MTNPAIIAELLALHNQERARKGIPPLAGNAQLNASANGHAVWMARRGTLSHNEGGVTPFDRISRAGYNWRSAAENIAEGQPTSAGAVEAWMGDKGHRDNVLGPYRDVGFGAAKSASGAIYWCADFGTKGGVGGGPTGPLPPTPRRRGGLWGWIRRVLGRG